MKSRSTFITVGEARRMLDSAHVYSELHSTCDKVHVGSLIQTKDGVVIMGVNHGVCNCRQNGCRRIKLYGENSKEHRLPSDCDSIHSEIDAISKAARMGVSLEGATIAVTRYPCESCARAIVEAGITTVLYGRREAISEYTEEILYSKNDMSVFKVDWEKEDNNA